MLGSVTSARRPVGSANPSIRMTGRTKAPSTFTWYCHSAHSSRSTATQITTETTSGSVTIGGRPSSTPRMTSATV